MSLEWELPDDLLPDLEEMRRDALIEGLGGYYPRYEGEIGTYDHLRPMAPRRYLGGVIELALDAFYREEAG